MKAATAGKQKVDGGVRLGNLFFSSGLTGKGESIDGQTRDALAKHKANLEALGSSLDNVLKVTAFLADVKGEKPCLPMLTLEDSWHLSKVGALKHTNPS